MIFKTAWIFLIAHFLTTIYTAAAPPPAGGAAAAPPAGGAAPPPGGAQPGQEGEGAEGDEDVPSNGEKKKISTVCVNLKKVQLAPSDQQYAEKEPLDSKFVDLLIENCLLPSKFISFFNNPGNKRLLEKVPDMFFCLMEVTMKTVAGHPEMYKSNEKILIKPLGIKIFEKIANNTKDKEEEAADEGGEEGGEAAGANPQPAAPPAAAPAA